MDMQRLIDYAHGFKQAAYGLFGLSASTGAMTYQFADSLRFMNENAPAIGVGISAVSCIAAIGFAVANYRINARRRDDEKP